MLARLVTIARPWPAASALVAAVASGLLFFGLGGAPRDYLIVNAASLALALAAMFAMPAGRLGGRGAIWIVGLCVAGMGATLVSGFDLDGVRRWLPLGPVRLHAAMLLLPAMLAALPRLPDRWQIVAVTAAAAITVLQPDRASAAALAGGFICLHWRRWREPLMAVGHGVVALGVLTTSVRPDSLAPVRFVENVVADALATQPIAGLLILGALIAAIMAPLWRRPPCRDRALGTSGAWLGFAAASMVGAYPTPLAGYGAAAILGYGLAIAVLRGLPAHR